MQKPLQQVRDLAKTALQGSNVTVLTPCSLRWDISARCLSPYRQSQHGRGQRSYYVDLELPCRRCDVCLRRRFRLWRERASVEMTCSPRSWFGTLTFNANARLRHLYAAMKVTPDFRKLSQEERFLKLHVQAGRDVTLWLKRMRKHGASMRYLVCAEPHKSGDPHYHLLVHEHAEPVRKADLESRWRDGFSHWRLVDSSAPGRAAHYVIKYLSKTHLARVRASLAYGDVVTPHQRDIALWQSVSVKSDPSPRNVPPGLAVGSEASE